MPLANWAKNTRQDYRQFGVVHGNQVNVLYADGHVGTVIDTNKDGLLNSGFRASGSNGFVDNTTELPLGEFATLYSLFDSDAMEQ